MSYLRGNGRVSGGLSGRWGRASISGQYQLGGAIEDLGLGPTVNGDPILALIAQLNRFAGKTVAPGQGCSPKKYLNAALPMTPQITDQAATTAVIILSARYQCVPMGQEDNKKFLWANSGLTDSIAFVTSNLNEIVVTLAQFGDKLGLEPAVYGITERDQKFTPSMSPVKVAIVIGGAALLAAALMGRKR